jgi:bacteriorhodopsin
MRESTILNYLIPIGMGIVFLVAFIVGSKEANKFRWVFITIGIILFLVLTIPQIYAIIGT